MLNLLPIIPCQGRSQEEAIVGYRRNRTWALCWYVFYIVAVTAIAFLVCSLN